MINYNGTVLYSRREFATMCNISYGYVSPAAARYGLGTLIGRDRWFDDDDVHFMLTKPDGRTERHRKPRA